MSTNDGLFTMVALCGAMASGPSNCGCRKDGKICTAQGGECRYNHRFYTPGMCDAKSWQQPIADDSCPERCCYLSENPRDMGNEEERMNRVNDLIGSIQEHQETQDLRGLLAIALIGGL